MECDYLDGPVHVGWLCGWEDLSKSALVCLGEMYWIGVDVALLRAAMPSQAIRQDLLVML